MQALRKAAGSSKELVIGMIPGDGIGRVVLPAAQRVLQTIASSSDSTLPKPSFIELQAGFEHFQKTGAALPPETVAALKNDCSGMAMFGAVSSPSHRVEGYSSPIVKLRKELGLFANVRPVKSVKTDPRQVEMTIVRENTECLYHPTQYVKEERISTNAAGKKVAEATRRITEVASENIGRIAFEIALLAKVRKLTIVHKSNVLATTDGLFRETVRNMQKSDSRFNDVKVEEQIVDSCVYKLFRQPEDFSVLVAPNLYGDIISDGAAALVGSLGLVPSVNAGDSFILGEPVHGSAPDIADRVPAIANPIAAIRSAALMLEYSGWKAEADRIYSAVDAVLEEGKIRTPDLGGKSSTDEVADAICAKL
ncbi:homoisocitrate dehydrogenase [Cystobasidiomycetes sp. EMM_F5]